MADQFKRFDRTVRKILSVSREELNEREKAWKEEQAQKKRARLQSASSKGKHLQSARGAWKKVGEAFRKNPKLQVPY